MYRYWVHIAGKVHQVYKSSCYVFLHAWCLDIKELNLMILVLVYLLCPFFMCRGGMYMYDDKNTLT